MKELRELVSQTGFKIQSSGFIREGNCWKDNPKKVFSKFLISPLLFVSPPFRDFLWIVAER